MDNGVNNNPQPEMNQQPNMEQPAMNQQPQPNNGMYGQPTQPEDKGSFGWAVLGFFIPLVGLILYFVWKIQ